MAHRLRPPTGRNRMRKQFWLDQALKDAASLMVSLTELGLDDAVEEVIETMARLVKMGAKS